MFARHDQPEPELPPEPEPVVEPEPEVPAQGRPISLCGTKEERLARFGPPLPPPSQLPPRLVSFGRQTRQVQGSYRGSQKPRIVEVEAYVDLNNPNITYVREPGSTVLHPQINRTGGATEILDRFTVPGRDRHPVSGHYPAGQPDKVVPFPEVSDTERAMARALFAKPQGPSDPPPQPAFDPLPW